MKNIFKKILIERRTETRKIFFLLSDIILISLSVVLAFLVRFEGIIPSQYFSSIIWLIIFSLIFTLPLFYFFKLYSFSWTYVSTEELISLAKGTFLSFLFLTASYFILRDYLPFSGFPRSTLFITYFFVFILCGSVRFAKRIYLKIYSGAKKEEKERTLIVGAGDAGEQLLRNILNSPTSSYLPLGFVDDNPNKKGILIHGLKVLGRIEDISRISKEENIESIIIALPSAGSNAIKKAVENGRKAGLKKIKIVPSLNELIAGQVSIGALREVEMEDLLGREPVNLDQKLIEDFVKNKSVLITGAAGSIGSELCRQVAKFKPALLLGLDQDETGIFNISEEFKDKFPRLNQNLLIADIQDRQKINWIFNKFQPQIVFHAAAYKHVPLMEGCPDEAVKNNIFGTHSVAETSLKHRVEKFILISTDKAVNPVSIMGATKRVGEMICQNFNKSKQTKFVSVRFGNVLNSRGSVIPVFREQIKKGGPVEITHPEMKRYFMTVSEATLLVMQAGAMGQGGESFVLDMGKPVKILDLAKEMIRFSGFEPDKDIAIVFTGVRPGEKFFEEILTAEEGVVSTQNQKIFIAKLSEVNEKKLNLNLEKLKIDAKNKDKEAIIKTLKKIIPNYMENLPSKEA